MKKEDRKEESQEKYLFADRKSAYLQGLMPETRRGLTPASSCLESGEASRAIRLSSAGRSKKEAEGIGVQELLEWLQPGVGSFIIFLFLLITISTLKLTRVCPGSRATTAEQYSLCGTSDFSTVRRQSYSERTASQSQRGTSTLIGILPQNLRTPWNIPWEIANIVILIQRHHPSSFFTQLLKRAQLETGYFALY